MSPCGYGHGVSPCLCVSPCLHVDRDTECLHVDMDMECLHVDTDTEFIMSYMEISMWIWIVTWRSPWFWIDITKYDIALCEG